MSNTTNAGFRRSPVEQLIPRRQDIRTDYEISNTSLGTGVSGKVYTCFDRTTSQKHALKILKDTPSARNEIDIQWRLGAHPNIVPIRAVYENNYKNIPHLFIVMDCMQGGELLDRIQAQGSFTERQAATVFRSICSAVYYMHQNNIAHRDLKPENILYEDHNEESDVQLTDFGFAKLQSDGLKTPCFTPYYVAPEVLRNETKLKPAVHYGKACDVWSLGVILYILLCGYPPFYTEHGGNISPGMKRRIRLGEFHFPVDEWASIDESVKDLIMSMLRVNANDRVTVPEIVKHPWVSGVKNVPSTPLATSARLVDEEFDMKVAVHKQLVTMRAAENIHTPGGTLINGNSGGAGMSNMQPFGNLNHSAAANLPLSTLQASTNSLLQRRRKQASA